MLQSICNFLDEFLKIREVEDYPNALNGLQLQNDGGVTQIGAAVDASETIIEMAVDRQVDLLIVHHGIFWGGLNRLVGAQFRKIKRAVSTNLAIYSAHLPLDLHPETEQVVSVCPACVILPRPGMGITAIGKIILVRIVEDRAADRERCDLLASLKIDWSQVEAEADFVRALGPRQVVALGIALLNAGHRHPARHSESG